MVTIKRALISVYDKTGIVDFGRGLNDLGIEMISSGGTARALKEADIPVRLVSDYTGFPEILNGRVKTLHPKIHAGILARREDEGHMSQLTEQDIGPIDMVVVNLYPFEAWAQKKDASRRDVVEMIDIGGPSMIRAAAKNYPSVAVVTDARKYNDIIEELRNNKGSLSEETCRALAGEAFRQTAHYDAAIAGYFAARPDEDLFPLFLEERFEKVGDLRYGENPHQRAAVYRNLSVESVPFIGAQQLWGKELSFNNYLDMNAAVELVGEFDRPAAVILKHTNPCGAALGTSLAEAYEKAYAGDPLSAFGSIVGFNRSVDVGTAEKMAVPNTFLEVIVAPGYEEGAIALLTEKRWWGKTVRILTYDSAGARRANETVSKQILGGLLVQSKDSVLFDESALRVVTERTPTEAEMEALRFAWTVVKHVKSNAILLAQGDMVVGVGAGQMSRVDSSMIAVRKAGERAQGAVLASDAFFPFRDAIDVAAEAGVTAAIQPGGSKGDDKVIEAANDHDLAMVFTGMRHFRHL
ncbi:MAG: bifunctional phosphoribosylaminoimidazolecarboxamide formyltransferase/IMP cyclohydrolase [Gemmatimonadota bacterium]|nr:MAG: bifunctional phosphoribosylaminoimidazolecarboxamide formyltransferase/IMP cyclohydrolase [Gemmatimonadota bacterium]